LKSEISPQQRINHAGNTLSLTPTQFGSPLEVIRFMQRLVAENQFTKALELANLAVQSWPSSQQLILATADLSRRAGNTVNAIDLYLQAEKLGSDRAGLERQALIDETAPYWHFRMMNDEVRNHAYDRAIQHYVNKDSIVLDIGCGAGLLSMMAARADAKHVYACEVSDLMYHQAKKIFKQNGFDEQITTINKVSNYLQVGHDLPEKADIIVAEIFDTGLLGEQALRTFAHARQHLLKPDGIILPGKASIQAVLIESELLHKEVVTNNCSGFRVDTMNELTPSYFQARLEAFPHQILSAERTVSQFDFLQKADAGKTENIQFETTRDGVCHGVCFWFTLDFGHDIEMSTGPENRWNCWMQAISTFDTPIPIKAGKPLNVQLEQTNSRVYFRGPLQ